MRAFVAKSLGVLCVLRVKNHLFICSMIGLRWMLTLFIGFVLSVRGEGIDPSRTLLPDSIREISAVSATPATGQPEAAILRRTLSPAESNETMEFEVALQMRNFPELQQRLVRGELIAPAEMASKYYPLETDYQTVAGWLTGQGF